jgi:hypothetical protein
MQAVVGLILIGGWAFSVHATWRSLGQFGVLLGVAIFAAVCLAAGQLPMDRPFAQHRRRLARRSAPEHR